MTLLVVHLVLTAAYAGFQWTVRGLVYPQFAQVPPEAFPAYERAHQRRVSRVVGPLFLGQGVTTLWLLSARPDGAALPPLFAGAACLTVVLGVTALFAVPLHRRLGGGWDAGGPGGGVAVHPGRGGAPTAGTAAAAWLLLG